MQTAVTLAAVGLCVLLTTARADLPKPEKEYNNRRPAAELLCLTPEALKELKPRPLFEWLLERMPDLPRPAQKRKKCSKQLESAGEAA